MTAVNTPPFRQTRRDIEILGLGGEVLANSVVATAAQAAASSKGDQIMRPFIIVDVLGFLPEETNLCTEDDKRHGRCE